MRDILSDLENWLSGHAAIALATVVRTWGSSPRGVGAKMAFTADGKITGSVSGGCVESAVFEVGVEVLSSGVPQLLHYGVTDEAAWEVGLACGGQIDVFVQPLDERMFRRQRAELLAGHGFAIATLIHAPLDWLGKQGLLTREGHPAGSIPVELQAALVDRAQQAMTAGQSQVFPLDGFDPEGLEVFVEVVPPQPLLVVVGGTHTTIALTRLAQVLGFHTVVVDPRRAFASAERFPHVDRLIQAWPDEALSQIELTESAAVAVLTHDPKLDDPALITALQSPAFYIGVLGSPTTQAKLHGRLLEAGVAPAQLARLHGPIGLKLGSSTPEEIALSIMAEIVAVKHRVGIAD
ncbi:MAG: XdhC/CoxI family protein [Anaerolineaceae bacterium]|nr:XdhC/CoxI family protein [Anaerolineaceae bacterium]